MEGATQNQMGPMLRFCWSMFSTLEELIYLEVEAICEVNIVRGVNPSVQFRIKSSREA